MALFSGAMPLLTESGMTIQANVGACLALTGMLGLSCVLLEIRFPGNSFFYSLALLRKF